MAKNSKQGLPIIAFASHEGWEAWLEEHHDDSEGLWLKLAKTASGIDSVSKLEALEGAVCYGWIDSQAAAFDDDFWLQRFTPRRPRSKWSKRNRELAGALMQQGRMRSAGLREVQRAKEDGRWGVKLRSSFAR